MKNEFKLIISRDGSIGTIYQDGLAEALGAQETEVKRASTVEWETNKQFPHISGWVVRSAVNPRLAICDDRSYPCVSEEQLEPAEVHVIYFKERAAALEAEVQFFWSLLEGKECSWQNRR